MAGDVAGAMLSCSELELYAILPTAFTEGTSADVDYSAIEFNVERLLSLGIDKVLVTGSYGEFQALSNAERLAILSTVRAIDSSATVMACAALPSTTATADLALDMLNRGANSVMVSPPLLCEHAEADVLRHFERLSRLVDGRLVIYNSPMFGVDLGPSVLCEVAEMDGYVAIKQGTQNASNFVAGNEAVRAAGSKIKFLAASDMLMVPFLLSGIDGLTSTNLWIFPDAFRQAMSAVVSGDSSTVLRISEALRPYRELVSRVGQPMIVKTAMPIRGFSNNVSVRLPFAPVSEAIRNELERVIHICDDRLAQIYAPRRTRSRQEA